jgi:hypothetical protein
MIDSGYNSNYNSLQLSLEKRMSHGLSFLADYTWSKSLNDFSESAGNESYYATYPFDRNANYGLATDDIPNTIKISGTWQVPSFNMTGAAGKLLSGWAVAPIITWRSGLPFSIMCGCDNSLTGDYVDRADFVSGATLGQAKLNSNRSHGALIQEYFNTAAFTQNAAGTFGNTPVYSIRILLCSRTRRSGSATRCNFAPKLSMPSTMLISASRMSFGVTGFPPRAAPSERSLILRGIRASCSLR